jgi:hypothetical protein
MGFLLVGFVAFDMAFLDSLPHFVPNLYRTLISGSQESQERRTNVGLDLSGTISSARPAHDEYRRHKHVTQYGFGSARLALRECQLRLGHLGLLWH